MTALGLLAIVGLFIMIAGGFAERAWTKAFVAAYGQLPGISRLLAKDGDPDVDGARRLARNLLTIGWALMAVGLIGVLLLRPS